MMPMYQRKPEVVEAQRFISGRFHKVREWCSGVLIKDLNRVSFLLVAPRTKGSMKACPGDWVVKTKDGFDVLSAQEFDDTFELIPDCGCNGT